MSASSDLIAAGHDFVLSVAVFRGGASDSRRMDQLADLTNAMMRVERAVATVRIVGSEDLASAALAVESSVTEFLATNVEKAGIRSPKTRSDEPQLP
jgi:hypothetical protein